MTQPAPTPRHVATLAATLVATLMLAAPANAAGSASTHVTVAAAAVRSVTVNDATLQLGSCTYGSQSTGDVLAFPHGECISPSPPTITNGGVAGHIYVSTTGITPSDNGTPWTICSCLGAPGPDQANVFTTPNLTSSTRAYVGTHPLCDTAFAPHGGAMQTGSCQAAPFQSATEYLLLDGPSSSTDTATTWSFDVTWTAMP